MYNGKLLAEGLKSLDPSAKLFYYELTDSTNTRALEYIRSLPESEEKALSYPTVFLADAQTLGRGRRGMSFVSKGGEGIFVTLVFRPESQSDLQKVTAKCAVALRRALKKTADIDGKIKWVNDLYAGPDGEEKKLCGILAEAVTENGRVKAVAVGIGINVYKEAITEEIADVATSVEDVTGKRIKREDILLSLTEEFYAKEDEEKTLAEYKSASLTLGRNVTVIPHLGEPYSGFAEEISEDYSLLVLKDGGERVRIFSGEVSTKIEKTPKGKI